MSNLTTAPPLWNRSDERIDLWSSSIKTYQPFWKKWDCLGSSATNRKEIIRRRFLAQLTDIFRRTKTSSIIRLPPKVLSVTDDASTFVEAPKLEPPSDRPWQLERLVRKFDPVERDLRNRSLGRAGEEFVLEIEKKKLEKFQRPDLLKKIRWVSAEEGDGAGYDILSFEPDGRERLIEVKTTNGAARTPFFLSENERQRACSIGGIMAFVSRAFIRPESTYISNISSPE